MKSFSTHNEEYAKSIAQLFLQNTGVEYISHGNSKEEDFIIEQNGTLNRRIPVDVKASKYSLADIKKAYKKLQNKYKKQDHPTLLMYINYESKEGYYHMVGNGKEEEIKKLEVPSLQSSLREEF